jgi:hypothetical protein
MAAMTPMASAATAPRVLLTKPSAASRCAPAPLLRARDANAGASAAARALLRKRSRAGCVPAGDATLHGIACLASEVQGLHTPAGLPLRRLLCARIYASNAADAPPARAAASACAARWRCAPPRRP